jgi:RHS repeat-associated protein
MGNIVQKCSYDAWGNREFEVKDPALVFDRGYTGHEHLDEFGLINMNGRMYDPLVGRFLSPDPFVQAPDYSQSFNRYSYCLNNPLIYTDPEGEFAWIAAGILLVYTYLKTAHDNTSPTKDAGNPRNWAWNPGKWNKSNFDDPNSFNFMINIGYNPNGGGYYGQLSVDFGKVSISGGFSSGDNYTSVRGGFSINGYGASYYRTSFGSAPGPDGNSNRQVVGELGFKIRGYSARIANDFLGDGQDRWRSNAIEIGIGDFVVGTFLYNNNPLGEGQKGIDQNHPEAVDRRGNFNRTFRGKEYSSWPNGKTYTSPGYVGLRNGSKLLRLGYSHEKFQDRTQNWVHRNGFLYLPMGHQNFYIDYTEFQRGWYDYSGYHNPYSLY